MKILIVKTSAIGDIIHAFPVLEYLKGRFPNAQIDWVIEKDFSDLLTAHPLVCRVFPISTKLWRKKLHHLLTWKEILAFRKNIRNYTYDLLFDLQGNTKSAFITAQVRAHEKVGFDFDSVSEKPNLLVTTRRYKVPEGINIQERYLRLVQAHFNDKEPFVPQGVDLKLNREEEVYLNQTTQSHTPKYLVAFGSNWPNKQLSLEVLERFLSKIEEYDHPFFYFIWGTPHEQQIAKRLQAQFANSIVVDRLKLPLLQGLIRKMDLVIAVDSMALHLCGKTPSFSLFGPSLASVYKPLGLQHHHFQGSCPYGKQFSNRCPILRTCSTGACLKDVTVQALFESYRMMRVNA